ncbi:MAG: TlpA disulfide reductase family protein [Gammaproteobacteria bacterium]|nr:TlpA disulfide reductase family protein [Gammaproteobacteria bacterium]
MPSSALVTLQRVVLCACLVLAPACTQEPGFRIQGDIGAFLTTGEAVLVGSTSVPAEERVYARAPIRDGRFELLGETGPAWLGKVKIQVENETRTATQVIVEPGSLLDIRWGGWVAGLTTAGGGPHHQQLVLSWRDSDAYRETLAQYTEVMTTKRATPEGSEHEALLADANRLYGELDRIRRSALDALAGDQEPLTALLAIEFGALGATSAALERLDELASGLSSGLARRVAQKRNRIEAVQELAANNAALVAGAIAPDFAAMTLGGDPTHLSNVVAANKIVLVDFWASWCAPCIKQFPHLKDLRAQYGDRGFEVVGVSLDTDEEDWREASADHGLTWVDLGDPLAFSSPAAVAFGVTHLPKTYLLDADRRILAKDLHPDALSAELAERLR